MRAKEAAARQKATAGGTAARRGGDGFAHEIPSR